MRHPITQNTYESELVIRKISESRHLMIKNIKSQSLLYIWYPLTCVKNYFKHLKLFRRCLYKKVLVFKYFYLVFKWYYMFTHQNYLSIICVLL